MEAESICIGCGLCCDGSVVTHLAVRDDSDLGAPLRALGVEVIVVADPPVFELPCPALDEGRCAVFDLHRPSACGQFECRLSRSVIDGRTTHDDARDIVRRAKGLQRAGADGREEFEALLDAHFRRV